MMQVLLHEGVDVARGYQAVLDHQGTCNSITLYEQSLAGRSKSDRIAAASCLLDHLYDELTELVRGDIARREAPAGDDETLAEMIEKSTVDFRGWRLSSRYNSPFRDAFASHRRWKIPPRCESLGADSVRQTTASSIPISGRRAVCRFLSVPTQRSTRPCWERTLTPV